MALSVKGKLQALCAVIVAGFALVFVVDILESRHTERTLALERVTSKARGGSVARSAASEGRVKARQA